VRLGACRYPPRTCTHGGLRPPPRKRSFRCLGIGAFHAQSRGSCSRLAALPVLSGCCLSVLQRQHKMQLLRF
jgi:hypothetical protein